MVHIGIINIIHTLTMTRNYFDLLPSFKKNKFLLRKDLTKALLIHEKEHSQYYLYTEYLNKDSSKFDSHLESVNALGGLKNDFNSDLKLFLKCKMYDWINIANSSMLFSDQDFFDILHHHSQL